ncbi:MAG TPA: carboxypeptidase-like regulatory domain-containing protein [Hanamia sp.]
MQVKTITLMKVFFLFLFLTFTYASFGQIKIGGTVKQSDSSILSYVNVGIKLKSVGTVSNESGQFGVEIPKQFLKDTLTFSYVGFEELNVPIQSIVHSSIHVFVLKSKTTQLAEIVIKSKELKQRKIGTKSHNPFLWGTAQSKASNDIIEFAKFINIKNKVSRIQSVHIYLGGGVTIDSATFRINFYNVANGLPVDKIVDKNIIERMVIKKGWLTIDLTKEKIVLDQNFFVSFEFMPEQKFSKYGFSYGAQFGGNYVSRNSSLGNWEKGSGASLSAYVTLLQ